MALISSAVLAFTPHSQSSVCRCPNDQSPAKTNPDTDLHPISDCVCLCVVQSSTDSLLIRSHRSSFRYSEFLCFEMWVQHITILTSHSDYHSHPILSCMCRLEFWEANVGFFYGNRLGEAQWLRLRIKPFQKPHALHRLWLAQRHMSLACLSFLQNVCVLSTVSPFI